MHDADDAKYFKKIVSDDLREKYPNAAKIMSELVSPQVCDNALEMISHVSASQNGNRVPEAAITNPELLWPRFCDRLEAIGVIGAIRCFQVTKERGNPLFCDETPKP